jgi:hypothetical protein
MSATPRVVMAALGSAWACAITSQRPLPGSRQELEPLPLEVTTDFPAPTNAPPDVAVARTVAVKLDRLPLALEQASTYLEQTGEQLANSGPVARLMAITEELPVQWVEISSIGAPPVQR